MPKLFYPKTHIKLDSVTAGYNKNVPIIHKMNFEISGSGIFQLLGNNGSGKSTVVELLSGYLPAFFGEVTVGGLDARLAEARFIRNICRTNISLYPQMSVRDHLILASRASNVSLEYAIWRAEKYGLSQWLDSLSSALSNGNRRKLWIIFCTLRKVPVIILDEPYLGIDEAGRITLTNEISFWAQESLVMIIAHAGCEELDISKKFQLEDYTNGQYRHD